MIQLKGVTASFGQIEALKGVDFSFEQGRTSILIGPSGCGKSTVVRLICGLVIPSEGEVLVGNERVTPENAIALRRKMGYVIQEGGLFPHLTAEQNVLLMARHLGRPEGENQKRLKDLLSLTHFPEDGLRRYPVELSGGQRQRVALMRGLMLDPEILLLDEPLGALDPMVRSSLQSELKEIFASLRKTVIFVTHDMAEAAFLGDRIFLMREGRVVQRGTLADLRERPAEQFVAQFIESQRSLVQI